MQIYGLHGVTLTLKNKPPYAVVDLATAGKTAPYTVVAETRKVQGTELNSEQMAFLRSQETNVLNHLKMYARNDNVKN